MSAKDRYRQFCRQAGDLPVFAEDWYLDSTCLEGDWEVALIEEAGQVVATWPYYLKQKGPFRYITMPPLTKFMGPQLLPEFRDPQNQQRLCQALFEKLPKVSSFNQNFFYSLPADAPFPLQGFSPKRFYSYRLAGLSDLDRLRAGLARYYRNSILPKAPSRLSIHHDLGVDAYYEINQKTYARQGIAPPFSRELLRSNVEAIDQHQSGKIFFAVDAQERIHAAALLIWDRQTTWYHSAGGDPDLRKSGAGIYIVWEMIRYAAEELQLEHFDFAGSMIPAIEKIWKNFGAQPRHYYHLEHHFSPLFALAQKAQHFLRKLKS